MKFSEFMGNLDKRVGESVVFGFVLHGMAYMIALSLLVTIVIIIIEFPILLFVISVMLLGWIVKVGLGK